MEHSQEEIINALKVIKDTCSERHDVYACYDCPLSQNNTCVLQDQSPEEWKAFE